MALLTAHAASFWMSNSDVCSMWISLGKAPALMAAWIWSEVPAARDRETGRGERERERERDT